MRKIININKKIAGREPSASKKDQRLINESVSESGILIPILLWRGELIDGRARYEAYLNCNCDLNFIEIGYDKTEEEAMSRAKSANIMRR